MLLKDILFLPLLLRQKRELSIDVTTDSAHRACTKNRSKTLNIFICLDPTFFVHTVSLKTVLSVSKLSLYLVMQTWLKLERPGKCPGWAGRDKLAFVSLSIISVSSASLVFLLVKLCQWYWCLCFVDVAWALQWWWPAAYYWFLWGLIFSYYACCLALTSLPGTVIHSFQYSDGIAWVCHH